MGRVPYERAARALWLLMQAPFTTEQMAARLGVHYETARVMLSVMCRVVPLYKDKGFWRICESEPISTDNTG